MPTDHECAMRDRIEALEAANKNHSSTHEKMFDRIRQLETENAVQNANSQAIRDMLERMDIKNDRMVSKVESIEQCVAAQLQTMNELNERGKSNRAKIEALEAKPGKRWDSIVDKAIWAVCAALIAFILAKVGLPV